MNPRQPTLPSLLKIYLDRRMPAIFILGFMQGFPWVLIGSLLSQWLKEEGLSRGAIGLFGLVGTVYAINALWAPLLDFLKIPWLTSRVGHRKAWILIMQVLIVCAMFFMATVNPNESLWTVAVVCLVIAFCGATQDIALDGLRIDLIDREETHKLGAGAAMMTSGWWGGFGIAGAAGFFLASFYEKSGWEGTHIQLTYATLSVFVFLSIVLLVTIVEEKPSIEREKKQIDDIATVFSYKKESEKTASLRNKIYAIYVLPVASFIKNYGLKVGFFLVVFILLFKVGEAFLGRMSIVFYNEIGFDKEDIGLYSKLTGGLSLSIFAIIGSLISAKFGLMRSLVIGGMAMATTNLLYAVLAEIGPEKWMFAIAVVADQFTTAISTVAFVAFISQLCDKAYGASQYAAFASLGNLSRTTLAAGSGFLVDTLDGDWSVFFVLTAVMVLPSLALLYSCRKNIMPLLEGRTVKIL